MNKVLDSPKIPDIAKKKFLDDIESKMEVFTKITRADIDALGSFRA